MTRDSRLNRGEGVMATQVRAAGAVEEDSNLAIVEPEVTVADREAGELDVAIAEPEVSSAPPAPHAKRPKGQSADDPLATDDPKSYPYDWATIIWLAVVHVGALAAPFVFTWKALGVCVFLAWLTGSI